MSEKIVITEEELKKAVTEAYIAGNSGRVIFGILDPISATAENQGLQDREKRIGKHNGIQLPAASKATKRRGNRAGGQRIPKNG
jgi:hypothetical protein